MFKKKPDPGIKPPATAEETSLQAASRPASRKFKAITLSIILLVIGSLTLVASGVYTMLEHSVVRIDPEFPSPKENGRLIYASGKISYPPLEDKVFFLKVPALALKRVVETYQWAEKNDTYEMVWSDILIDSSTFKEAATHPNPATSPLLSQEWIAEKVTLGKYTLSPSMVQKLKTYIPFPLEKVHYEQLPDEGKLAFKWHEGSLYFGMAPMLPRIGDIRIRYEAASPQEVSILASQDNSSLLAYQQKTAAIEIIEPEVIPKDTLLQKYQLSGITSMGWGIVSGGIILFLLACGLLFFCKKPHPAGTDKNGPPLHPADASIPLSLLRKSTSEKIPEKKAEAEKQEDISNLTGTEKTSAVAASVTATDMLTDTVSFMGGEIEDTYHPSVKEEISYQEPEPQGHGHGAPPLSTGSEGIYFASPAETGAPADTLPMSEGIHLAPSDGQGQPLPPSPISGPGSPQSGPDGTIPSTPAGQTAPPFLSLADIELPSLPTMENTQTIAHPAPENTGSPQEPAFELPSLPELTEVSEEFKNDMAHAPSPDVSNFGLPPLPEEEDEEENGVSSFELPSLPELTEEERIEGTEENAPSPEISNFELPPLPEEDESEEEEETSSFELPSLPELTEEEGIEGSEEGTPSPETSNFELPPLPEEESEEEETSSFELPSLPELPGEEEIEDDMAVPTEDENEDAFPGEEEEDTSPPPPDFALTTTVPFPTEERNVSVSTEQPILQRKKKTFSTEE